MTPSFVFAVPHTCTQIVNRGSTLLAERKGQEVRISVEPGVVGLRELRFDVNFKVIKLDKLDHYFNIFFNDTDHFFDLM